MNINEKINIRSYYKDTILKILITSVNRYELTNLKIYNFHTQPYL